MAGPGFVHEHDSEERQKHTLRHALSDVEIRDNVVSEVESLDGSRRERWTVGEGFVDATAHPDDVHDPLVGWIEHGGSEEVRYCSDLDEVAKGVPCTVRVRDSRVVDRAGWTESPLRLRLVPIEGATRNELVQALRQGSK